MNLANYLKDKNSLESVRFWSQKHRSSPATGDDDLGDIFLGFFANRGERRWRKCLEEVLRFLPRK